MTKNSIAQIGRQWLTLVMILMAIAVNGVSNVFPPAGKNTGEVSNITLGGVLITPAGYAFAIWGLIYLGLIAYGIYQALPAQRHQRAFEQVSWAIIGACVLQIIWIYVFLTYHFWWAAAIILGITGCLIAAYLPTRQLKSTRKIRWFLQAPISIYFAWITIASVLNVSGALYVVAVPRDAISTFESSVATTSPGGVIATVAMMCISAGIAAIVALRYADVSYPAVAVWAFIAIAVRTGFAPIAFSGIALAVGLSIVIVRIKLSPRPTS
ncbi:MAG: TspO/MBR family protein [Cyanobacteria bacterium J06629_19]